MEESKRVLLVLVVGFVGWFRGPCLHEYQGEEEETGRQDPLQLPYLGISARQEQLLQGV